MSERERAEFVRAMNDATLAWTQGELARDPRAFFYGPADLTEAVHRAAHYEFVRDEPLYLAFRGEVGRRPLSLRFRWLRHVLAQLLPRPVRWRQPAVQRAWDLVAVAAPGLQRYRHWYKRSRPAASQPPAQAPRVVFYAVAPKMLRYLRPIAETLRRRGVGYAFGTAFGLSASDYLAERLPCLGGGPGRTRHRLDRRGRGALVQLRIYYGRIHAELAAAKPECVVVCEGCHTVDAVVAAAARDLGIRSVCLQQGWPPTPNITYAGMRFDSFVTWGEGFAEHLRPFNPNLAFVPLGSHILPAGAELDAAWAALDTPARQAVAVALQPDVNAMPAGTSRAMIEMTARLARAHPAQRFLIREHPNIGVNAEERALLDGLANVTWRNPGEVPLNEFLAEAAVVVAVSSTTLLEGMTLGAIPVVVNVQRGHRHRPDFAAAGAGIHAEGTAEAEQAITRLLTDDAHRRSFREPMRRFAAGFFRQDGDPLERIADHLV